MKRFQIFDNFTNVRISFFTWIYLTNISWIIGVIRYYVRYYLIILNDWCLWNNFHRFWNNSKWQLTSAKLILSKFLESIFVSLGAIFRKMISLTNQSNISLFFAYTFYVFNSILLSRIVMYFWVTTDEYIKMCN